MALGSDMSGCSEAAVLRGGFTLQPYRRLCERGFAVGRSGGDAAAHFMAGTFGMLRSARTGPGAARFLWRRAVVKRRSLPPASNHKKLRGVLKYTRQYRHEMNFQS